MVNAAVNDALEVRPDGRRRGVLALCERCDWSYLLPDGEPTHNCPRCQQAALTPVDGSVGELPAAELAAPFSVADVDLGRGLQRFAGGFLFAPHDLNAANLRSRLQRVYLPRWLVDCDVQAEWRAETGFNYQVVSHQDQFNDTANQWQSQEVRETRIRWEQRAGRLARRYENVAAPAIEEDKAVRERLGEYDLSRATAVDGRSLDGALLRMANRPAADAWTEAVPVVRERAVAECRTACQADHIRGFDWLPQYSGQVWTQLLLPVYTTFYRDEGNAAHVVFIHGQTGRAYGRRQAAFRPARNLSLALGAAAVLVFLASLALALLEGLLIDAGGALSGLGSLGVLAAMGLGILAVLPVSYVWIFNHTQPPDPPI